MEDWPYYSHCKFCGSKVSWTDGAEIDYECGASECDEYYTEYCKVAREALNKHFWELTEFDNDKKNMIRQRSIMNNIKLKDLLELINNDSQLTSLSLDESIDLQTYYYLSEIIDIDNIYPFDNTPRFTATFKDDNDIQHFIKINKRLSSLDDNIYEVKFGFIGKDKKPSYDRPNIYYNVNPDEKIFNTYLYILLKTFIEKLNFFGISKVNKLYLPASDYARYRLYRLALNKLLDKSKYDLVDGNKNELIIQKKYDR